MADKFTSVENLYSNRFLNFYHMDALTDTGRAFDYFFVSRNSSDNIKVRTHSDKPEGCVIYPLLRDDPGKIILIRQYRYPLGRFIYELPAGLLLSLIGTPFFILVLMRRGIRGKNEK